MTEVNQETRDLLQAMSKASGETPDDILSGSRRYPLPALRWMIAEVLLQRGYSPDYAARQVGIDRATFLYGRRQLGLIESNAKQWYCANSIMARFRALVSE